MFIQAEREVLLLILLFERWGYLCCLGKRWGQGGAQREREKRGQAFLKGNHSSTSVVCPKDGRSNNAACEGDFCLFFVCLRSLEQKKVDEQ